MFRFLIIFAFLLTAAPALAADFTLFDHTVVTNVGYSDYTDPRDDEVGRALHVKIATFIDDPAVFVPLADDLFEELFLPRLADLEFDHALVVIWRPEADDPGARRYGQDVYYDRGASGIWTRSNHLDHPVRESNFGPMFSEQIQLSGGAMATFYPPLQGYHESLDAEVLLARLEVDVPDIDLETAQAVILQFLEEYIFDAMVIAPIAEGGPSRIYIKLYQELPQSRFEFQQSVVADFTVEQLIAQPAE